MDRQAILSSAEVHIPSHGRKSYHKNGTRAAIIAHLPIITALREVMNYQKRFVSHPLFLAVIVAMWNGHHVGRFLDILTDTISQVEN
jgi:hypothetical protein